MLAVWTLSALIGAGKCHADSHPSAAYGETRRFYAALGYQPLEVFPALWAPHLPVLQMIKVLAASA